MLNSSIKGQKTTPQKQGRYQIIACFNTIPFYWPFETSVPFRVCFSAAKSSGKNSLKMGKHGVT